MFVQCLSTPKLELSINSLLSENEMSISNPEYFAMTFDMEGYDNEIWMAMLSDWPFEAFHEDGNTIIAYILKHDITQDLLESVNEAKGIRFREYEMESPALPKTGMLPAA